MRYLSVCSGVEAASVAWHDLGWTPVGFSEIEPFPSAVLAHRFPSVKNYGDMTKYKEWDIEPGTIDVLVGGTPCQSFSVAGLRKGLDDPRGNLMLVYLGLAEHLRVPWLVWENVPGVLSSNGGRDFGTFLGALGELGYRWSFRVLDAQSVGGCALHGDARGRGPVPQRRRRVFVVAHLGDGPHPASVLFESESLRGDSAKGGKKGQGAPRGAGKGAESGGRVGVDIVGTLCSDTHPGAYSGQDAYTGRLVPQFFDEQASDSQYGTGPVASTCSTRDYKDATDLVVQPVCATGHRTHALTRSQNGATEDGTGRGTPIVPCVTGSVTHTLKAEGFDGSEDGTGRGTPIVPAIAFHPTQDPISSIEVTHALGTGSKGGCATTAVAIPILEAGARVGVSQTDPRAGMGVGQDGDPTFTLQATKQHAVAFAQNTRDEVRLIGGDGQVVGALAAQPGMKQTSYLATAFAVHGEHSSAMTSSNPNTQVARPVETARCLDTTGGYATSQGGTLVGQEVTGTLSSRATAGGGLGTDFEVAGGLRPEGPMAVRRLLPVECERLQGFPDDWTNIPWRGKPAPDGPRYKAMGNSMAVPVMRWIGQRLDRVAKGEI